MKNIISVKLKFIVSVLLSALLAYAIGIFGNIPWWCFVFSNLLISIAIVQTPFRSFLSGALGIGLLWFVMAYGIDENNKHILSVKVATLLPLKGSSGALVFITSLIGFLLGGLASLTGSFVRKS
jgi:hypothetical protein